MKGLLAVLAGAVAGIVILLGAGFLYLSLGMFDVSAIGVPGGLEQGLASLAMDRSIEKRAPPGPNPLSVSREVLAKGLDHYRENCLVCHGAPGLPSSEIAKGLNPPAPDLTNDKIRARSDGEVFWVVSHGIRMTGMPAFMPTHEEEEIWEIVAFIRHLPALTSEEKSELAPTVAEEHHRRRGEDSEKHDEAVPDGDRAGDRSRSGVPQHHHRH